MDKNDLGRLRVRIKELEIANRNLAQVMTNIQPVLGRLIAAIIVLQNKGMITNDELRAVQEKAADDFIAAANPKFAEGVRSKPDKARPVASDSGNGWSRLSGVESTGRTSTGDTKFENGECPSPSGLSEL